MLAEIKAVQTTLQSQVSEIQNSTHTRSADLAAALDQLAEQSEPTTDVTDFTEAAETEMSTIDGDE
jgi:hypothetical protein